MTDSFQSARTARLILAHQMAQTYAEIEGFAMCPFLDYEAARRWLDED
jgi:hypothetical protein